MIAVVCVRDGFLPAGAEETVGEAGGDVILMGSNCLAAAAALPATLAARVLRRGRRLRPWPLGSSLPLCLGRPGRRAAARLPDGRDLAPRLAAELDRPLLAGAVAVSPRLLVARHGGLVTEEVAVLGPVVATLLPGTRGVEPRPNRSRPEPERLEGVQAGIRDAELLAVLPPDPATMDLTEARRIVAGGAGLRGAAEFAVWPRSPRRSAPRWAGPESLPTST